MSPRISFSNDFADLHPQSVKLDNSYTEAPVSSDFEFSAPNDTMISADELFFKGKMVPLRENYQKTTTTTLRDELLAGGADDDYEASISSPRSAKGIFRWKGRLGLRRKQSIVPKKGEKSIINGSLERIDEMKSSEMVCDDVLAKFQGERLAAF